MTDQADGSFDGRWLVWNEYHSLADPDDFTTWSWDSTSGQVRAIGAAERRPAGGYWPSPWRSPDASGGFVTWTQGTGPSGAGEVHLYDLAKHRDRVVRRGHPQGSLMLNERMVAWPESMHRGRFTVMRTAAVTTGKLIATPAALSRIRGVSGLATDGAAVAYPNSEFTSLMWAPTLRSPPERIFATRDPGAHVDNSVQVGGRYVFFAVAPNAYVADTATHRYIRIGASGYARLDNHSLLFVAPAHGKAIHQITDVRLWKIQSLPPIPPC
jgi:hypothetical protein